MTGDNFFKMLGGIDEDMVAEAYNYKPSKINTRFKWVAAAVAVLAFMSILISAILINNGGKRSEKINSFKGNVGGIIREYNDYYTSVLSLSESGGVWSSEDLTLPERAGTVFLSGVEYGSPIYYGKRISSDIVGERIGKCELSEADHREYDAFAIEGVASDKMIAVKVNEEYYLHINRNAARPENLGELMENLNLDKFWVNDYCCMEEKGKMNKYFSLENNDVIMDILDGCRDSSIIEEDFYVPAEKYVDFIISYGYRSIYDKVFRVDKNGIVFTNVLEYGYVFDIGKENADKIFSYIEKNGKSTYEQRYYVMGIVNQIDDAYIYVDDSVCCLDGKEGLVYRVPLDNTAIERYVRKGMVKEGSVVSIEFYGNIDADDGNLINGAFNIVIGTLNEDGIRFPE